MLDQETSINVEKTEIKSLLEEFKLAVNRPRLYVFKYFKDLKNQIDIEFCKSLNKINNQLVEEQVKEEIYEKQDLIKKVNEFESLCLININEDSAIEYQVIIEQIENNLNRKDISQEELIEINDLLSNEVERIQKIQFQDKSMFFVNAIEIKKACVRHIKEENSTLGILFTKLNYLSELMEQKNFSGMLITMEGCFIRNKLFKQK